jgi:hypothetical protein
VELAPISNCALYHAGHQMHWIHWKQARNAPHFDARLVSIDDEGFVLALRDGTDLHWWHHDLARLRQALELPGAEIQAVPSLHAVRVDNHWFNCSQGPFHATCARKEPRR